MLKDIFLLWFLLFCTVCFAERLEVVDNNIINTTSQYNNIVRAMIIKDNISNISFLVISNNEGGNIIQLPKEKTLISLEE